MICIRKLNNIKKSEIADAKIPKGKNYTLLKGDKDLSLIYGERDSFNEKTLLNKKIEEAEKRIDFEKEFKNQLKDFSKFKSQKKKENLRMQYFNDKVDRYVNNILDYNASEKLSEVNPNISKHEKNLEQVKDKCGSTTKKILRKIRTDIKKEVSKNKIKTWNKDLEDSFTKIDVQKKIKPKKESLFAIGFVGE